jgi:hypothetical protein
MCISVFAKVRRESDGAHLIGIPGQSDRWRRDYSSSDWYIGERHWDLALIYDIAVTQNAVPSKSWMQEWWRELGFFKKKGKKDTPEEFWMVF